MLAQVLRAQVELDGWAPVVDIGFYKDEHVAVLAGSGKGSSSAHVALLPMPPMSQDTDDHPQPNISQVAATLARPPRIMAA